MKKMVAALAMVSVLALTGCVTAKVADNAVKLGVNYSWQGTPACSDRSPRIKVAGVPSGTVRLKVGLTDLDVTNWNHGGGEISNDGSGVIPAGALKSGYNGPCPPSGQHRYEFAVKAIDDKGVVIGMGSATRPFPPK